MKFAAADLIVWLIIAAIVFVAKIWGKLAETSGDSAPPPPRPRPRPARPQPMGRAIVRRVSPPVPPKIEPEALPETMRRFLSQLQRPPPVAAAPPKAMPAEPPAPPAPPPPAPAAPPVATSSRRFNRGARWAAALRDKQNVRNIIISAEIIGRPKGLAG